MGNISAQTNSTISAKPKIRLLTRFVAQDLKIGSFCKIGFVLSISYYSTIKTKLYFFHKIYHKLYFLDCILIFLTLFVRYKLIFSFDAFYLIAVTSYNVLEIWTWFSNILYLLLIVWYLRFFPFDTGYLKLAITCEK